MQTLNGADWIWNGKAPVPKNTWLCFRRSFTLDAAPGRAVLGITADSQYFLYINGKYIGSGPAKCWPSRQCYDEYDVHSLLNSGRNAVCVLVNHFGTSTSTYVYGHGGLLADLEITVCGKARHIGTDEQWKVTPHTGYDRNTGRINIAFPWIESYDARRFPAEWITAAFDDQKWQTARAVPDAQNIWKSLEKRDVALLLSQPIYPKSVLQSAVVKPRGQHFVLNFRPNFYPACVDSKDRMQLGCAACVLHAEHRVRGIIHHLSKKWPEVPERFSLNGKTYVYALGEAEKEVELSAGDNLLVVDLSGGYQRFELAMLLDFSEPLRILKPALSPSEEGFCTIGPFDQSPVHNIASMEDIVLTRNTELLELTLEAKNCSELLTLGKWVKPVAECDCCWDSIKLLTEHKDTLKASIPKKQDFYLCQPNSLCTVLDPSSEGDRELLIDFGQETIACLLLDLECEAGVVLDFNLLECVHDGRVEYTDGLNNTMRYITCSGRQQYRSMVRRGFRYALVTVRHFCSPVRIYGIWAEEVRYPTVRVGNFHSRDARLNEIWQLSRRTMELCMDDTFSDSAAYEQSCWLGDAQAASLFSYYLFDNPEIAQRSLVLGARSLERSPLPEAQVPTGCDTILTAWSLLWVITLREYYQYTDDLATMQEIYPYLQKAMHHFTAQIDNRGILNINAWNLLDWAAMDTPCNAAVAGNSALLVRALHCAAELAQFLGHCDEADFWLAKAKQLDSAVNRWFWDEKTQAYIDSIHFDGTRSSVISMQTQILMLLCGCAHGIRRRRLVSLLFDPVKDMVPVGSPFFAYLQYEAMLQSKRKKAPTLVLENIRRQWGTMLEYGATSCWETFLGFYKYTLTRSYCHAWSAAPAYLLGAHILGVTPLEPGFRKARIAPALADLYSAEGEVPTPLGPIRLQVTRKGGDVLSVYVTAPEEINLQPAENVKLNRVAFMSMT